MKFKALPLGFSSAFQRHWSICLLLFLSTFLFPILGRSQARVDLLESGRTAQGSFYSYRIVGASFSATEQLKALEQLSLEQKTFSSFSYDASKHICRVEVGKIGGDRTEPLIRHYLQQVVGGIPDQVEDSRLWEDDDPRHRQLEPELPNAIPEPTDPATMPDWGNLQPPKSIDNQTGTDQ